MSMFWNVDRRIYAFSLNGNHYFYDGSGYGVEIGNSCYDGISEVEFYQAKQEYEAINKANIKN